MKRKSPEEKLGALIREIGFDKAESVFRTIKSYEAPPKPKQRKKSDKPVALEAAKAS